MTRDIREKNKNRENEVMRAKNVKVGEIRPGRKKGANGRKRNESQVSLPMTTAQVRSTTKYSLTSTMKRANKG